MVPIGSSDAFILTPPLTTTLRASLISVLIWIKQNALACQASRTGYASASSCTFTGAVIE